MTRPVYVLIHGAWHDSRCWETPARLLRDHACRVLTPDLPGHGENSLPLHKASLRRYSDAVCSLLQDIDDPVILVGHSMAGLVACEAACRLPDRIARLVFLSAYLPQPGQSLFDLVARNRGHEPATPIEQALRMSDDKRSCTLDTEQAAALFYSDLSPPAAMRIAGRLQAQATLPLSARARFDQHVFDRIETCYIACERDRVIPPAHQRAMLARQPCRQQLSLDSDHSPFYSRPRELAELLQGLR